MSAEITTPPTNITYGPELPPGSSVNPNPGTLIFHPPLLRPATTNQLLGYDQPDNVENGGAQSSSFDGVTTTQQRQLLHQPPPIVPTADQQTIGATPDGTPPFSNYTHQPNTGGVGINNSVPVKLGTGLRSTQPVCTDPRSVRLPPPQPHYPIFENQGNLPWQLGHDRVQGYNTTDQQYYTCYDSGSQRDQPPQRGQPYQRGQPPQRGQLPQPDQLYQRGQLPQHGQPIGGGLLPPYHTMPQDNYYHKPQFDVHSPLNRPHQFYVPRKRGSAHYGWCEGCSDYTCISQIAIKDYDSAERVVDSLKPLTRFHGAEDRRSGTAFIDEMFTMTEGHPEVVKYLWLKRYTTSYVWTMITDGIQPPTRCHRAYELQRSQLIHRISHHYDSLDHVQRSGEELAHCTQGKTTVYQFIRKLETLASELYNLGSPVPYRDLKLRLHKGLRSMMLRQKLDVDLMNDQMPFEHFRDQVLLQHKRLVNYYGVDYETKEIGGISVRQLPEPYRTTGSHTRGRSRDSNREHSYRSRDYTPKSTTSDEPTTKRRSSVHSVSHYGEDQQDDYSIKHLLAIRNDVTGFKCFRCDAEGHSAKNCPELSPVGLTTRCRVCGNPEHTTDSCRINAEKLLCHRCNLPGHLAYVCGTKLPVASTTKVLGPTTATTRTQSATGKGSGRQTSNRGRPNTTVHAAFLNETTTETGSHCYTLRSSRTRTPTPDPRVLHRHGMMTGYVTIEDTEVIAIYDTGADVSLITASCLNEVAPDATINTNIPNTLSAANGGNLHTIGSVMLRVSTSRTSEVDTFLVTTVPLTTPVILGCPTMSLLKTRITINSAGYDIETNYATPTDKYKVRFHDHVQYSDDDSKEPTPLPHCVVDYKIKHINQLCLQEHCEPCDYDGFTLQPTTPWFSTIFPETTSIPINDDSLIRGQGPCNHGRNDTKDTTTLGYGVTNYSGPPNNCVTTVANGDDANSGDYTTLGYGVTNCSGPPNNCVTTVANGDDANSGDYLDYTSEEDNLPPWQVLQREWTFDENTPLGRAIVHAPWKDSTRPPMNYRQAAARGARCTTRLSSTQLDAFHQALDSYINKKFCTTVQQNNIDNYEKGPSFKDCQDAWDKLTKGTSYEGTTVIMPKHYTAAHLVYRNDHPTTPCRVVLDYRTLNQYLLRGGRTQHDLQGTLLQLRAFVHFVGSDISKAFCQMKTALSDLPYVNYTCIGNYTVLWSSVSFGTTSAPNYLECCMHDISGEAEALCQVASTTTSNGVSMNADQLSNDILLEALLRPSQEAFDYIRSGPEVPVELILLKYVDDLFNGGDTPEAAMRANKFSLHILGGHGFKVDALKNIDSWTKLSDTETKKSILGYRYHDEKLYIVYSGELVNGPITKRQACSALASLYDPLGLIIECDLKGRLIWRTICDNYKLWTDIVDINVANEIRDWILECEETTKLGIPRHIPLATQPLLVSTDASTNFWGVDIRCTNNKEISPRLLARGGLFPKAQEKWTIPRKELVALYKGLQLLKTISPYLPVPTYYKANQSPLDSLAPVLQPRQVRLLCDSEITIYRLRKPSNDKRLPAAERRRLIEVRKLCKELDVIILHIRSELNYVDTVSRAKLQQDHIDPSEVLRATTVAKVIYDYRDTPDKDEDDVPMIDTSATTTGIMAINEDGIDLPDVDPLPTEQRLELEALMAYAKPTDRIHEGLLEDTQYNDSLRNCILRAQEEDEDIQRLKAILQGSTIPTYDVGATRLQRLSKICFLDDDGLLRRYPEPHRLTQPQNEDGLLHLGRSFYSALLVRILSVIFHYLYGHLGTKRVFILLRKDYWRDGMYKLVRLTLSSCIPCLKARATRQHNYLVTRVQTLLTEGLWQIVGVDLAGPYGRSTSTTTTPVDDFEKNHYLLLVHDYVSGFTVARPLRDSKSTTVAASLDNVFLEHGSPAVLLTDHDRTILSGKAVKTTLARHGTKHYMLPSYAYYLGFWERAHKDFVEVVRALQASRPITGPHSSTTSPEGNYIADYMVAVRAYNHTPRLWANATPFQLHYGYSGRLPGLHPEMDSSVDWDTLNMRFVSTNAVDFIQENVPLLTEVREKTESTLGEYLELWRIKQQQHLERYAQDHPNNYEPRLFDLIYVTRRSDTAIGNHLRSHWHGPYTVVRLQGSSMVKAVQGILLEGIGGVETDSERTTVVYPPAYGASESFALKNVTHADALQEAVLHYYRRSQRAYLDSDGTLRCMKLTTPLQPDDSIRVAQARDRTALQHMRVPCTTTSTSTPTDITPSRNNSGFTSNDTPADPPEERLTTHGSTPSPTDTTWATPAQGSLVDSPQEAEATYSTTSSSPLTEQLRDHFGVSKRPLFGKFMANTPMIGTLVVSTTAPHIGLSKVIDTLGDGFIQLKALDVTTENSIIATPEITTIDDYSVHFDTVMYVRPTSTTWTRARGKQLLELLVQLDRVLQELQS